MSAPLDQKRRRETKPALEHLDLRIAPTAVAAAAALAAELKVEGRQVVRWEGALATATPGSHRQKFLLNHIASTEHRMAVQEARLARIEARSLSRGHASPLFIIPGRPPLPLPSPPGHPPVLTPAALAPTSLGSSTPTSNESTGTSTVSQASDPTDTGSPPSLPPNASRTLEVIYDAYQQDPSGFPAHLPSTDGASKVVIQGSNVGIQVHDNNPADFAALVSDLQSAGMQIQTTSALYGTVVGMLPIAQLPAVAELSEAPSVTPLFQASIH